MSKTEHMKTIQKKASSPEARAKAAATMKRRNVEKKALLAAVQDDPLLAGQERMSLDAIPDREPKRKYKKRSGNLPPTYTVTEDEWLFLQMAKRMLRGVK